MSWLSVDPIAMLSWPRHYDLTRRLADERAQKVCDGVEVKLGVLRKVGAQKGGVVLTA